MATYRRFTCPGAIWFFTLVAEDRMPLLAQPDALHALARALAEVRSRYPFDLLAWTVLPDHIHAMVRLPLGDSAFARRISIFKRLASQRVATRLGTTPRASMRKRRESGLWQRRFWDHMIRDEVDLRRHLDYIHYNSVKHGYARSAAEWPHASFHRYVRNGILPFDWAAGPATDEAESFGE